MTTSSSRVCYMAGQWLPESEAKVSVYDLSVMQAAAAFEMTRSFTGETFRLSEHLERLMASCRLLHIPMPCDLDALTEICWEAQERNKAAMREGDEHRLLIVVSPGAAPIYHDIDGVQKGSWLYVADFPLRFTVAGMGHYFTDGVKLATSPYRQVPSVCFPARAKHRSRLHFHLAQQHAAPDWAVLLTMDGVVAECPGANVCAVFGETLRCTTVEALPGISQQTVAQLAEQCGLSVEWDELTIDDLWNASEVFITGTPFCVLPVCSVDGRPIGNGKPGLHYSAILRQWGQDVGVNIAEQIMGWDGAHAV